MGDFDVLSLLEFRKCESRSHGSKTKGNKNRKMRAINRTTTSLKCLLQELKENDRHLMLPFLSSLPVSVLHVLETGANKFYDRNHPLYDAALLTRRYTQRDPRPFIDSEKKKKTTKDISLMFLL